MEVVIHRKGTVIVQERDAKIVDSFSNGISTKIIAKEHKLSVRTVESIFTRLRIEFNCKTTTQLVATFLRNGLIK